MAKQYKKKSKISEADAFVNKIAKKSVAVVSDRIKAMEQAMRDVAKGGDFKVLMGNICV